MFEIIAFAAKRIMRNFASTKVAEEFRVLGNSRVASTARATFKGSDAQRLDMSNKVLGNFYNNTKDVFVKNSEISKEQLEKELKKSFPGINLKCISKTESFDNAALETIFDKTEKTIIGYNLELPFYEKSGKLFLKESEAEHLYHEVSHLGNFVYTPKLGARLNTNGLNKKFAGFEQRSNDYNKFYRSDLYVDEFIDNLKMDEVKILARKEKCTKSITNLFNKPEISSEEKIEVLQGWRNSIKTELSAFPNGMKYGNQLEIAQAIKQYKGVQNLPKDLIASKTANMEKTRDWTVYNSYFFADKKKIIEEMLKKEIAKVRKNSAQIFNTAKAPVNS